MCKTSTLKDNKAFLRNINRYALVPEDSNC